MNKRSKKIEYNNEGKDPYIALPSYPILVLLVDDQLLVADIVRSFIDNLNDIDLHYCNDATDAVRLASEIQPTVILQDLLLPSIDGMDIVRAYRSNPQTESIPIIVLSSREDPKIKAEAFASGANDYMVKFPDELEVIARIRYHSQWYINKLQRDYAYRSLQESQRKLEELNRELIRLSSLDGLTGIANRRYFEEYLPIEWRRARREQSNFSLAMIDIDFFKLYNDNLGHLSGDDCLKRVVKVIRTFLKRPGDVIARFGGEEFALILPQTDNKGASTLMELIRNAVEMEKIEHPDSEVSSYVTISIGVATVIPQKNKTPEKLLEIADSALYEAKHAGRNKVCSDIYQ